MTQQIISRRVLILSTVFSTVHHVCLFQAENQVLSFYFDLEPGQPRNEMENRPTLESTRAFIQQITSSDLRKLVFAVRQDQAPPGGSGIRQLDRILFEEQERVKASHSTTEEIQYVPSEESRDIQVSSDEDGEQGGLRNGDMIEVQGPSGSGKTEIIYQVTISRILPKSHTFLRSLSFRPNDEAERVHVEFGGPALTAVIYSLTSAPFSLIRLSFLLKSHIQTILLRTFPSSEIESTLRDQIDDMTKTCLRRVRLCRINESRGMWGLAIALRRFKSLVEKELEGTEEVGLVAVDGFGESFWADRAVWEEEVKERQSKKRKALGAPDEGDRDAAEETEDPTLKEKEEDASQIGKQKTGVENEEDALKNQPMYQALLQLTSIRQRYAPLVILTTQLLSSSTGPHHKSIPSRPSTQTSSSSSNTPVFTPTHLPYPYHHPFPPFRRAPPREIRGITYHLSLEPAGSDRIDTIKLERTETDGRVERKEIKGWVRGKGWVGEGREGRELSCSVGVD